MARQIRQRPQGHSMSLGASDPRDRRANTADIANHEAFQKRILELGELKEEDDMDMIRKRVNDLVRLVKEGL